MSLTVFLILAATVTIAAFIQGAVGVGFALICAPVIGLIDPGLLPVSLLILMLPLNVYLAWRERPALDSNGTLWITVGRTVGAVGGVLIISRISAHDLNLFIGASTIAAAVATLCAPTFAPGRNALITAGAVTGITETATGIGGPALAMVFQHYRAPALRSTIALCFAIGEAVSLVMLSFTGQISVDRFVSALLLVPPVILGAFISQHVHQRLNSKVLRISVMGFAIVSGAAILYQTLT
ncbi:sulfite exporter TauE/SafE family protein [Paraburkholderia sacchari]|uniref:sulfite exporter TauE/SafE family protein n=1 Tax=Paraburkholderia sacchari TaxID=159450 RepID=UPI0005419BCE|nr:sulfite exporter TauE/SafE family protein [Paraburkholderia sacchari]NLP62698.1 sulfite exporter TauE/SafE family protein [Paraburkholderia sacchari]